MIRAEGKYGKKNGTRIKTDKTDFTDLTNPRRSVFIRLDPCSISFTAPEDVAVNLRIILISDSRDA